MDGSNLHNNPFGGAFRGVEAVEHENAMREAHGLGSLYPYGDMAVARHVDDIAIMQQMQREQQQMQREQERQALPNLQADSYADSPERTEQAFNVQQQVGGSSSSSMMNPMGATTRGTNRTPFDFRVGAHSALEVVAPEIDSVRMSTMAANAYAQPQL